MNIAEIANITEVGLLIPCAISLVKIALRRARSSKTFEGASLEQTTKLPINFVAQNCSHDWDEIIRQTLEGQFEKKMVLVLKCGKCGLIDKTIESTPLICKHEWDIREITVKSAHEQMNYGQYVSVPRPCPENAWTFGKQTILGRTCRNCGETKETKAENTAFQIKPDNIPVKEKKHERSKSI